MKKAGIFAAFIATVLIFMQLYNFKVIAFMEEAGFTVVSDDIVTNLKNGVIDGIESDVVLTGYPEAAPLYQRGGNYYIGDQKEKINRTYPIYVNEGNAILNLSDETMLVTSEFRALPTYEWLYVSEGISFNADRQQADPDEFILARLSNGLYLNVQEMTITGGLGDTVIPHNSVMSLSDTMLRYYVYRQDGTLQYLEFSALFGATVKIGSVECTYLEFLDRLKGFEAALLEEPEVPLSAFPEDSTAVDLTALETSELSTEDSGPLTAEESAAAATLEVSVVPANESSPAELELETSSAPNSTAPGSGVDHAAQTDRDSLDLGSSPDDEEEIPDEVKKGEKHDGEDWGDEGSGLHNPSQGQSGGSEGGGWESEPETGGDIPDYIEPDPDAKPGKPGEGLPGGESQAFKLPEIIWTDFEMGVYSISTDIKIKDPTNRLVNGFRFVIYRGDSPYLRKLVKLDGPVTIEPLPPDTYFFIEGYFEYFDRSGSKAVHTFLPKTRLKFPTRPVSDLLALDVTQSPSNAIFTDRVQINGISINDLASLEAQEDAQTDALTDAQTDAQEETEKSFSAIPYITGVYCNVRKKGVEIGGARNLALDSSVVKKLKAGDTQTWTSNGILDSNTDYEYELAFFDRFNNQLKTAPKKVEGEFYTSKIAPKAAIRVDRDSSVEKQIFNVTMDNPDQAEFIGTNPNPYFYVALVEQPDQPLELRVEGIEEPVRFVPVKVNGTTSVAVTNLNAGSQYVIRVLGSFDLLDGKSYQDQKLGEINYTSSKLNTLGSVNFTIRSTDVTATSGLIRTSMRSSVNSRLLPYLDHVILTLSDANHPEQVFYTLTLKKEVLEKLTMESGSVVIPVEGVSNGESGYPFQASIRLSYPSGSASVTAWRALFTSGSMEIQFDEGNLKSATSYQINMRAWAAQPAVGNQEAVAEDVTGRYFSGAFKTLKLPTQVGVSDWFASDNYVDFYDVFVNDPDGAVVDGKISVRLSLASSGKVMDVKNFNLSDLNKDGVLSFSGLLRGLEYRVEFYALEYNETYSNLNAVTFKRLPIVSGSGTADFITFQTGSSIWGSIKLASMNQDYVDGSGVSGTNLFSVNDVSLYQLTNGPGMSDNKNFSVSDYMPVEEGEIYLKSGNGDNAVHFYDSDKKYLGYNATDPNWMLVGIPEGAAYARMNVAIDRLNHAAFMKLENVSSDSSDNLVTNVAKTEGYYYNSTGTKVADSRYFCTDLIPVEPDMFYTRMNSGSTARDVVYYDSNKKFIKGQSVDNGGGGWYAWFRTPANAKYVAINGNIDKIDEVYLGKVGEQLNGPNLHDPSKVHDGYYLNNKQNRVKNDDYWYTDYIAITPNTVYYTNTGAVYYLFYDNNYRFLGYENRNNSTLISSEEAAYVRFSGTQGRKNTAEFRQISPAQDPNQLGVSLDIVLEDPDNNLYPEENRKCTVLVESASVENPSEEDWKKEDTLTQTIEVPVEGEETKRLETQIRMALNRGYQYRMTLQVELDRYNRTMDLDSASVETDKKRYIIKNEAGFASIRSDPFGEYLAVADIISNYQVGETFYGVLDFQGHSLTREDVKRTFYYIGEGAVIQNLVFNITYHTQQNVYYDGLLCIDNSGTIRNIIANIKLNNQARMDYFGVFARANERTGIIENFVLNLEEDAVLGHYAGMGASENHGIVRNGYLYGNDKYKIVDFEEEEARGKHYRGGIVGINYRYGTVTQVYSLVDTVINSSVSTDGHDTNGTVLGRNDGSISNVFTTGHMLVQGKPTRYGPAIGKVVGLQKQQNIQYVQLEEFTDPEVYYNNTYHAEAKYEALSDRTWYDYLINTTGQFQTEMVPAGYYPRVELPDSMVNAQPMIPLPTLVPPVQPILVSASVEEQREHDADIILSFTNPQNMYIDKVMISKRDVDGANKTFTQAMTTKVVSQQMDEDGVYRVKATVTDPTIFRSEYYIEYFTFKAKSTSFTSTRVDDGETIIGLQFYKTILTINEWGDYVKSDMGGNFRIGADLDFSGVSASNMSKYILNTGNFTGNIDGGYTDEDGVRKNHKLIGIDATGGFGYFINNLYGTIENLDIVDFDASGKLTTDRVGFIRTASRATINNVHMRGAKVAAGQNGGCLVSVIDNSTVQNSSVTDSVITSWAYKTVSIGSMAGHASNTRFERCFVQGVSIDTRVAHGSDGIGGFAGQLLKSYVSYCYAQGTLETNFPNTGGFVGYMDSTESGILEGCWTKMDINASTGYIGGIAGKGYQGAVLRSLAVGDIFSRSKNAENLNRIMGYNLYTGGSSAKYNNGAYKGQFFDGAIQSELVTDEDWLLDAEDLKEESTYLQMLNMDNEKYDTDGSVAADEYGISQGYLPRLLSTEGELLPNQTPVPISDTDMKLTIETLEINTSAAEDFKKMFSDPYSMGTVYGMQFKVDESNGYAVYKAQVDGMDMTETWTGTDAQTGQTVTKNTYNQQVSGGSVIRRYPFLRMKTPYDRYKLDVIMTPADNLTPEGTLKDETKQVLLSTSIATGNTLYMTIQNAAQWNEVMSKYKDSYGNFVITGDIDASTLKEGEQLVTGVRVNRLYSTTEGGNKICNIDYSGGEYYEALIQEAVTEITNLTFENITWTSTSPYADNYRVGIIGTNMGLIHNVDFKNISINTNKANDSGCIGMSLGEIRDVDLTDIKIVSVSGNLIGGLVGRVIGNVSNISAKGTVNEAGEYSYRIEATGDYTGGLIGHFEYDSGRAIQDVFVDTIKLVSKGGTYAGLVGGIGRVNAYQTDIPEVRSKVANSILLKTAGGRAGGVLGGISDIHYVDVINCTIQSTGKGEMIGGICGDGWNSTLRDCTVSNSTVSAGGNYVGGAVGYSSNSSNVTVKNTVVSSEGNYVGGLAGLGYPAGGNCLVENVSVTGTKYVGGLVGAVQSAISNSKVVNSRISGNTYVGGFAGINTVTPTMDRNSVSGCVIKAAKDTGTSESYAGGFFGSATGATSINRSFVDQNTTVDAYGNYVGGFAGAVGGGSHFQNYSAALVNQNPENTSQTMGLYVGGLYGETMSSHKASPKDYRTTKIYDSYFAGKVTGQNYVAGLFGLFTQGEVDHSASEILPSSYYNLIMAGDVNTKVTIAPQIRYDANILNGTSPGSIGYLRAYDNSRINGFPLSAATLAPKPLSQAEAGDYPGALSVTSSELSQRAMYVNPKESGGLGWTNTEWSFDGMNDMQSYEVRINPLGQNRIVLEADIGAGEYDVTVQSSMGSYVSDGLLMHFDGINNTRQGHDPEAKIWENLTGNPAYDLEPENLVMDLEAGESGTHTGSDGWTDISYRGQGTNRARGWKNTPSRERRYEDMTISATFRTEQKGGVWNGLVGWGNNSASSALNLFAVNGKGYARAGNTTMDSTKLISDNKLHNLTAVFNYESKGVAIFLDGILVKTQTGGDWAQNHRLPNAFRLMSSAETTNSPVWDFLIGDMYNAKVYTRKLTAAEVAHNYATDVQRFGDGTVTTGNQPAALPFYTGKASFKNGKATIALNEGYESGMYDIQAQIKGSAENAGSESAVKTGQFTGYSYGTEVSAIQSVTAAYGENAGDVIGETTGGMITCTQTPKVSLASPSDASHYQWYRSNVPGYAGEVMEGEGAETAEAVLSGRGYYYCKVSTADKVQFTPLIAVETDSYLPYIRDTVRDAITGRPVMTWQEGFTLTPKEPEDRVQLRSGTITVEDQPIIMADAPEFMQYEVTAHPTDDTWYAGGAPIRDASVRIMTLRNMMTLAGTGNAEDIPSVRVYPSGIDTINIEFSGNYNPAYYFIVQGTNGQLLTSTMDERVYTLYYDYKMPLKIIIGDHTVSASYEMHPTEVRRTVMTWEDDYYYLSGGRVLSSEDEIDGDFNHLYEGKALTASGEILDADTGKSEGTVPAMSFTDTRPLHEFEYDGKQISAYEGFSVIEGGEEPLTQEFKLVEKDGELYALDTLNSREGGLIADAYQEKTYIALLDQDGTLNELADTMERPVGIGKSDIAHMSNNLDCSQPWLLLRYSSGYAKGFNYITGEELELTNVSGDMSLIEYVGSFLINKLDSLLESTNPEYLELMELKDKLTVTPLDESMLISGELIDEAGTDSGNQIKQAEGTAGTNTGSKDPAEDAVAGDSKEEGESSPDPVSDSESADKDQEKNHEAKTEREGADTDGTNHTDGMGTGTDESLSTSENGGVSGEDAGGEAGEKANGKAGEKENGKPGDKVGEKAGYDSIANTKDQGNPTGQNTAEQPEKKTQTAKENHITHDSDIQTDTSGKAPSDAAAVLPKDSRPGSSSAGSKKSKYVYVYNDTRGRYDLYKTESLLTQPSDKLMTEQEKIEQLSAKGLMNSQGQIKQQAAATRQEQYGFAILALTGAAALGLTGFIIYRKRRYYK